jgi:hypothetical protein
VLFLLLDDVDVKDHSSALRMEAETSSDVKAELLIDTNFSYIT